MNRNEIFEKIKFILVNKLKLVARQEMINEKTNLLKDFSIDSVKIVNLLVELENTFHIDIDSEDISFETLTDIPKMIDFVDSALNSEKNS